MADGPIDVIHNGVRLHLQPGESPRQAMQRQAELSQAKRRETIEFRAKVLKEVDAEKKAADAPSEPEPKRKGFASKIKVAGGNFNAFGKHEQRSQ